MTDIVVKQTNGVIDANFEEVKAYLEEQLSTYRGLQFTEETKKDAKKSVAELRKLKTAIEDKRKEVKKVSEEPYKAFEAKVKELTALIDEPIDLINSQISEFEKKRIEEKQAEIQAIYEENVSEDMREIYSLRKIFNQKWENATCSRKDIEDEIQTGLLNLKANIQTIRSMKEECEEEALTALYRDFNIADAINYINDYKAKKEAVLKRQQEREAAEKAAAEKAEQEKAAPEPEPVPVAAPAKPPVEAPGKGTAVYEFSDVDDFDLNVIEALLEGEGIRYRRIS